MVGARREEDPMSERQKPRAVAQDRIEVAASPEVLWSCFADLKKWPHWFPALVLAEWTAGTPWTVGAQFRQTVRRAISSGFPGPEPQESPFDGLRLTFSCVGIVERICDCVTGREKLKRAWIRKE